MGGGTLWVKVSQMGSLLDRAHVAFDDGGLVANAGVGLISQLADHLALGQMIDERVTLGARPARKVLSVVCAMTLGADCIDDVDVLRSGATARVLGFRPMAASTVGSWLRSLKWGHVRQLDGVLAGGVERAWRAGAGPGAGRLFVDADSTIKEVYGAKQGAAISYNDLWSLHPLFVSRGDTGEVLGARLRRGSATSAQGASDLIAESINTARRGGATGEIVVRADSAFYNQKLVKRLGNLDVRYSISAPDNALIRDYVSHIPESAWRSIPYRGGVAQVAETLWRHPHGMGRIIARRVKNTNRQDPQQALFTQWKTLAFVTDRDGDIIELDREHRARAAQETQAIRELKENALARLPSANFAANAAWLALACIAHNLTKQLQLLGQIGSPIRSQATIRRRLLTVCGRITRSGRRVVLHLPARWPWQRVFIRCVHRLRWIAHPT
jgi:hypothetical protein